MILAAVAGRPGRLDVARRARRDRRPERRGGRVLLPARRRLHVHARAADRAAGDVTRPAALGRPRRRERAHGGPRARSRARSSTSSARPPAPSAASPGSPSPLQAHDATSSLPDARRHTPIPGAVRYVRRRPSAPGTSARVPAVDTLGRRLRLRLLPALLTALGVGLLTSGLMTYTTAVEPPPVAARARVVRPAPDDQRRPGPARRRLRRELRASRPIASRRASSSGVSASTCR